MSLLPLQSTGLAGGQTCSHWLMSSSKYSPFKIFSLLARALAKILMGTNSSFMLHEAPKQQQQLLGEDRALLPSTRCRE